MPNAPSNKWDTTIIADPPPVGVTKDCYDLTDFDNSYLDNPNPPKGFLDPGETCSLTALLKRQIYDTYTIWGSPPDPEYKRCLNMDLDGTLGQWERAGDMVFGSHDVRFSYYDGDGGLGLSAPYLDSYGFFLTLPSPYTINVNWRDNGCIVAREPANLYDSSLLYRPAINLPPIAGAPAGWTWQFGGQVIAEQYIPSLAVVNDISKQLLAVPHVQSFAASDVDYIYHMGTFPANGQTFQGMLTLEQLRSFTPILNSVSISPGVPELTMVTTFPALPAVYGGGSLVFNFASASSGTFQREVTMVYDNGVDIRNRKIRVIAEALTPYPDVSIKSQEYNVVMVASTPVETLDGPIQDPIPSKFKDYDLGFNDTFFAVKGSTVYAKKQYTITNTTASPITNLNVYWQGAINAQTSANAPTGNGMTLLNLANCTGVSLAPAATCTFELKWQPPTISAAIAGFLSIQYEIAPNQYISKSHRVLLNAGDPAILSVFGMSTVQVQDNNDSGFIRSSYPVDWGPITLVGHIQTVNYPHTVSKAGYWVRNASTLKASFLKMLEPGPVPGGNPVLIYNVGGRKVYGTRACLYGDDEFDGGVPAAEKGFNISTVAACNFTIEYDANEAFVGKDIDEKLNVLKVEFYNNKRSSTAFMWFHLKGFVEPNYSTVVGGYTGVTALNNGTVTVGWPAFTPQNATWGAIAGYTIFQTQTTSLLDNVHTTAAAKVDLSSSTFSHTFTGLQGGRYYYFKVVARRTKNGKTYYSENKPLGKVALVVPPANTIYSHSLAGIIDRAYQSGFGTKTTAVSNCASKFYSLVQGGLTVTKYRQLMNTNVWNFLKTDPDTGAYSTYSDYAIPAVSHWLIDAPTDIAPIFAPYGFDTTATTQYVASENLLYQKPCSDNSCNLLDKIVGGDGSELPFDATLYMKGNAGGGVFRCWAPI
jgi:hypothetical protein